MVLALSKLQSKGKVYKWKDRIFFEELIHKVKVQGLVQCELNIEDDLF